MKRMFIIFILSIMAVMTGCGRTNTLLEDTSCGAEGKTEYSEENSEEKATEKLTESVTTEESISQQYGGKNMMFTWEQGHITEIYVDGKLAVKNEYQKGLRAVKKGIDYCEFTYNSERDITSEIRNGKLITYLYKQDENSMYELMVGFNYEGNDYYYTKDEKGRINGINNADGELIAKYEYGVNSGKVEKVFSRSGDKWVTTDDENFIGNINRVRGGNNYFDIETELYYGNGVFVDSITGQVIR